MSEIDGTTGFTPPAIDDLNQWLPSYDFINLLACGGMGAVYEARQISLDRVVAVKILPPELAIDETFRKSFEAEGKAMARLSHSNLVGVYDFGEISNMLFLVMEYVEGSNLHESKGDSVIDAEVAVTLIRSVASGLAESHRMGLVHRDIKPANILINTDLVPKLGDFGLAVPDSDIESGLMMGTPAYLAPEITRDPSSASFASDTYALGVILYEMLTGSSIEQGDVMDLARVPMLGNLPSIIRKAVDPRPLLRYQSGEQFERALNDWIRKPKGSSLAMRPGETTVRAMATPVTPAESGGGGGLILGIAALLIVGGVAWFTMGKKAEPNENTDNLASNPGLHVPADPLASPAVGTEITTVDDLESIRTSQQNSLAELSSRMLGERTRTRREFLEAAGEEGEIFLKSVTPNLAGLPRYFSLDEVTVSETLLNHLLTFAKFQQAEIDQNFQLEISSLHRDAMQRLRTAKVAFPAGVSDSWERWAEWLGQNPLKTMHTSTAGLWRLSPANDGFELHLSATGKSILVIGDERIEKEDLIQIAETGEISLKHSEGTAFHFPWKLRWLGDRLEGEDAQGGQRVLRLVRFDYAELLKVIETPVSPATGMAETDPDEESSTFETFQDPEVATLTENYRKALNAKIEPLELGYLRVLERFRESYRDQGDDATVEQIEEEREWLENLGWKEGFIQVALIAPPGELPKDVAEQQAVFRKEFQRRFDPIQRTYLSSLTRMLRVRKGSGNTKLEDIEKAIKKLETPEGVVQARYVKIESLPDQGISHATIAMIEIVDLRGHNLPIKNFSKVNVSSFEKFDDNGKSATGESAIDGDPKTFWHSKWREPRADFPHWISFDLGGNHWIKGFSITSRIFKNDRSTDVTNWQFHTSPDGKKWTMVAKGNFPKGNQPNEHLGFEEIK